MDSVEEVNNSLELVWTDDVNDSVDNLSELDGSVDALVEGVLVDSIEEVNNSLELVWTDDLNESVNNLSKWDAVDPLVEPV